MNDKTITIDDIDLFVFDFDGVLTDNLVYTDQNGNEMVSCSRADGLAFDVLRKLKKPVYILSILTHKQNCYALFLVNLNFLLLSP